VSGLVWRMGHGIPASALQGSEYEVFSPCAAAALYRRSALLEVGGFDEDFFCYVEDVAQTATDPKKPLCFNQRYLARAGQAMTVRTRCLRAPVLKISSWSAFGDPIRVENTC
jgi:hypothetical protein